MARAIQKIHRHYVEEKAYDLLDLMRWILISLRMP
jgi:hypothetical protein